MVFSKATTSHAVRVFALVFLAAVAKPALPQSPTGAIHGVVKDSSGGVVQGAKATLKSSAGLEMRSVQTDRGGLFGFESLIPGAYQVEISADGFATFLQPDLAVVAGAVASLDVVLALKQSADQVEVTAKLDPFEVVPDRPTNSVFGFDKRLEEIPRSISVVSSETVEGYQIHTVNDLVAVASGSFTGSYFGIPGTLFVRGDESDNYFRGFRRAENEGSYSTPLGAAETIEVVKGPPPTPYGAGKTGGFLNFIPKSARSTTAKWMQHPEGKVSFTYGSYDEKFGSVEFGAPLLIGSHRAGLYIYGDGEDSHSFYHYIVKREKLGQIAFDSELGRKWRIEMGMQGYLGSIPQNVGWNRVTQALIDHGTYLAGTPLVNLSTNGYNITPSNVGRDDLQQFVFTPNYAPIFRSSPQAPLFALNPATVHLVHLNNDQIIADTDDFSTASTYTGYFDLVRDVREGFTYRNQTFVETLDAAKYTDYEFSSYYNPKVVENKTTLDYEIKAAKWLTAETTSGFAYRHTDFTSGESRTPEENDRRDLSLGPTANDRFVGAYSKNAQYPYDYFQQGTYGDVGLFFLTDVRLFSRLSVLAGVRYDHYNPESTGRDDGEPDVHESGSAGATTYNVSVSYRLPRRIIPYFTYATSSYLSVGQGGEVDYSTIPNRTYLQPSHLYETGVKMAISNKLLASLALFKQQRATYNTQSSGVDYYRTKGIEFEIRAALTRQFSFTTAYTYQLPQQLNIPFELGIPPTFLGLTPQESYGGRFIGDLSIFNLKTPVEVAGQPKNFLSVFGTYTPRRHFGVNLGTTWSQKVRAGYINGVILPAYAVLKGSLFYDYRNYSINLAADNLTNEHYFTSQYLFWDTFVKPSQLRTLSLTVAYRFGRDIQ